MSIIMHVNKMHPYACKPFFEFLMVFGSLANHQPTAIYSMRSYSRAKPAAICY